MLRKLPLIIATAATLFSLSAFALGLGEAEVNSVLGEPLDAKITLLSATEMEGEQMSVVLASPDRFRQAGIPFTPELSQLILQIERNASGIREITVKTEGAVKEPFLDFIVELTWPNGQLVREYTLLLDPPVLMPIEATAPQAVATPTTAATSTVRSAPAAGADSWTVRRGDTLWKIAERVRPDASLSVHQVMSGLQRANPDAFIGGNINRLKSGVVLRVPAAAELAALNQASARSETSRQYDEWRDSSRAPQAATAPAQPVVEQSRVKLVVPEQPAAEAAPSGAEGTADVAAAATADTTNLVLEEENAALRLKVDDLEEQITRLRDEMSRLLTLPDNELAELTSSLREQPADEHAAIEEHADEEAAAVAEDHAAEPAVADEHAAETEEHAEPAADQQAADTDGHAEAAADEHAAADDHAVADAHGHAGADDHAAPVQDPGPLGMVRSYLSPYLPAYLLEDRYLMGGAGAIVLLLILALIAGRRRKPDVEFDSISAIPAAGSAKAETTADTVAPAASASPPDEEKDDMFGDFMTDSDIDTANTSSDPLGEADVYLAYGRSREAEELLLNALENEPGNPDYHLKLLDVYQGNEDREAFVRQLESFEQTLGGAGGPQWDRALQMTRLIAPDHRLLAGDMAPSIDESAFDEMDDFSTGETGDEMADDFITDDKASADIDLDFEPLFGDEDETAGEDLPLDVTQDFGEQPVETKKVAEPVDENDAQPPGDAAEDDGMLEMTSEFDIGGVADSEAALDDEGDLDFDLDFTLPDEETAKPETEESAPVDEPVDLAAETSPATDEEAGADEASLNLDKQFDELSALGFGDVPEAASEELGDEMVGNKLELARAYVDMEDWEGAREILAEVIEEGSETQQKEAQELLARCS